MFARQLEVLIWIIVLVTNTSFQVWVYEYISNVHIRKAVYITLRKYKTNKQNVTFEGDGGGIATHHREVKKIVMVYNRYLDRIQHNQPQQSSSSSTKQLSKIT